MRLCCHLVTSQSLMGVRGLRMYAIMLPSSDFSVTYGRRGLRMYAIMLPSSDFSVTYGCEGAEDVCDYAAI